MATAMMPGTEWTKKLEAELDALLTRMFETLSHCDNDYRIYRDGARALLEAGVRTAHAPPSSFGQWLKDVAEQTVAKAKGAT